MLANPLQGGWNELRSGTLGEQARRLREACELLRGTHPEHAAACVFAAAMLEAGGETQDFRR